MYKKVINKVKLVGLIIIINIFLNLNTITTADNIQIGILDIDELVLKTGITDRVLNNIKLKYYKNLKKLDRDDYDLQCDIHKYNHIMHKLKPDEIHLWQRFINDKQIELQNKRTMLQENIISAQEYETKKMIEYYLHIVTQIAKKYDLSVVVFKDVTAFNGNKTYDITNEVILTSSNKNK